MPRANRGGERRFVDRPAACSEVGAQLLHAASRAMGVEDSLDGVGERAVYHHHQFVHPRRLR